MNASSDLVRDPQQGGPEGGMARDAERVFVSVGEGAAPRPLGGSVLAQPMVVAGFVVVLAAGAIGGMHVFGPREASADGLPKYEASVHAASDAQRAREMVETLDRSARPLQFASTATFASPFAAPMAEQTEEVAVDAEDVLAQRRERELAKRFEDLTLNSVLGGSNPVARINQEVYRVGDVVDGVFTIERITGRGVLLRAEGQERPFVLVPNTGA